MGGSAIRYTRSPGYATANLGEEIALLDMNSGSYLGFNATASEVWRFLEAPRTLDALCSHLSGTFDVDDEQCRATVVILLRKLSDAGLVRAAGEPGSADNR